MLSCGCSRPCPVSILQTPTRSQSVKSYSMRNCLTRFAISPARLFPKMILGVLVTRSVKGFNKTALRKSEQLPVDVLNLICRFADPYRFPWITDRREPSPRELRDAIDATMTLHASQSLQTERRGYGKDVEKRFEIRLTELGFNKASAPHKGKITAPIYYPTFPNFYGECTVHGRKFDLFIALPTGRMIALEAKDSSSALNSVKRLNNDTAAKARHFATQAGKNIINVALLSGVFKVESLILAQQSDLYLVWAHDLDQFIEWVKSRTQHAAASDSTRRFSIS